MAANFQSEPAQLSIPLSSGEISGQGSFNDDSLVRGIVASAIKHSRKSCEEIAEEMSALVGTPITMRMIRAFTAASKQEYRWPSAWDRVFCHVTGDTRLLRTRAEMAGFHVIDGEEFKLLQLGREYLRHKEAAATMAAIELSLASRSKP